MGSKSYILLEDSPPTFVFSHLVVVWKFRMPPIAHNIQGFDSTYELTFEVISIIQQGFEVHMLADVDAN